MHWIIWEFQVGPSCRAAFEALYGRSGEWSRLFQRAAGYLGSELLRDQTDPGRYLTIDRWRAQADFEAFRAGWGDDYEELDRRCAPLTERERALGSFLESRTVSEPQVITPARPSLGNQDPTPHPDPSREASRGKGNLKEGIMSENGETARPGTASIPSKEFSP